MAAVFDNNKDRASGRLFDRLAIVVSGLCLVQCLMLPLVIVLTPLASAGVLGEEWFHLALLLIVLPLSLVAFHSGYRLHRNRSMLIPGLLGLSMIALAALGEITHLLGHWQAAGLTSLGGVCLILGHWINLRQRRVACLAR